MLPLGDEEVAGVEGQAGGSDDRLAEAADDPRGCHLAHRVAEVVGDVEVAGGVEGQAVGSVEPGGEGAEHPCRRHLAHHANYTVGAGVVGDVEVAGGVEGQPVGKLNPEAKVETVGEPESVTGMLNVPALALTVSLPALKLTDDSTKRSSNASRNALRSNTFERLRRPPFWAWRRRECFNEENQDASVMGPVLCFVVGIRSTIRRRSHSPRPRSSRRARPPGETSAGRPYTLNRATCPQRYKKTSRIFENLRIFSI